MNLIIKRLERLEAGLTVVPVITGFKMVVDDEADKERLAMLDSGHTLVRDTGMFRLWRRPISIARI